MYPMAPGTNPSTPTAHPKPKDAELSQDNHLCPLPPHLLGGTCSEPWEVRAGSVIKAGLLTKPRAKNLKDQLKVLETEKKWVSLLI